MMLVPPNLPLKAMHLGTAPPWWQPAPGWWMLVALVALLSAAAVVWVVKRRRRRQAWARLFDAELADAVAPQAQAVAIAALLRRAARRIDPQADHLEGAAWLRLLDHGMKAPLFEQRFAHLLTEGLYQRTVDAAVVSALRVAARKRFLRWMEEAR